MSRLTLSNLMEVGNLPLVLIEANEECQNDSENARCDDNHPIEVIDLITLEPISRIEETIRKVFIMIASLDDSNWTIDRHMHVKRKALSLLLETSGVLLIVRDLMQGIAKVENKKRTDVQSCNIWMELALESACGDLTFLVCRNLSSKLT